MRGGGELSAAWSWEEKSVEVVDEKGNSTESVLDRPFANGTLRTAIVSPFAASFAREVASSRAIFAAALAPSGPVNVLPVFTPFSAVERVTIGEGLSDPFEASVVVEGTTVRTAAGAFLL